MRTKAIWVKVMRKHSGEFGTRKRLIQLAAALAAVAGVLVAPGAKAITSTP